MPAVPVRDKPGAQQVDALDVPLAQDLAALEWRGVPRSAYPASLQDTAAMIERASERSVPEAADRADIRRRYEAVITAEAGLASRELTGSGS